MTWNIFSDPHLGVGRQAHTTAESSKRLDKAIFAAAMQAKSEEHPNFIAGDLFDKTFNSERVICQGIAVAAGNTVTLAGNHDETNREGTICSLEVVQQAECQVLRNKKYKCLQNLTDQVKSAPALSQNLQKALRKL